MSMADLHVIRHRNGETRSPAEILREATITYGEWMRRKREGVVSADASTDEEEAGLVSPEPVVGESESDRGDPHANPPDRSAA